MKTASTPVYSSRLLSAREKMSWELRTRTADQAYVEPGYCIDAPAWLPTGSAIQCGHGFALAAVEKRGA